MACFEAQTSVVLCCLAADLFHISLAGLAACSITFNYPPCQQTDIACLLALVITGFRGQVIRSWLHCHPVRLLRLQEAYGMEEFPSSSVISQQALICMACRDCTTVSFSKIVTLLNTNNIAKQGLINIYFPFAHTSYQ